MTSIEMIITGIRSIRASSRNNVLICGTIGIALGIAAGLLIAPRAGKESRDMIEKKLRLAMRRLKRATDGAAHVDADNTEEDQRG